MKLISGSDAVNEPARPRKRAAAGRGWVMRAKKGRKANSPTHRGALTVAGKEYWISAWVSSDSKRLDITLTDKDDE